VIDESGVPSRLTLEIRDDGSGYGPGSSPGVGLASMHERAVEVGGDLTVEALPDGGTHVKASLPLGSA
jgi:signal transduction histidine kinase